MTWKTVQIHSSGTLFSIFGDEWRRIYDLDINADFRKRFPDPNEIHYGWKLYYPPEIKVTQQEYSFVKLKPVLPKGNVIFVAPQALGDTIAQTPLISYYKKLANITTIISQNTDLFNCPDLCDHFIKAREIDIPQVINSIINDNDLIVWGAAMDTKEFEIIRKSFDSQMAWLGKIFGTVLDGIHTFHSWHKHFTLYAEQHNLKNIDFAASFFVAFGINPDDIDYNTKVHIKHINQKLPPKSIVIHTGSKHADRKIEHNEVYKMSQILRKNGFNPIVTYDKLLCNPYTGIPSGIDHEKLLKDLDIFVMDSSGMDFYNIIDQADVFISPDTGPAHVRHSLKKPLIAIESSIPVKYLYKRYDQMRVYDKIPTRTRYGLTDFDVTHMCNLVKELI